MALDTYSALQTSIKNWLHREDLTGIIPDFITLCEAYLNDKLRLRSMISEETVNPSQSNKYVALPTGFLEPISFVDDYGDSLAQVHPDELHERAYGTSSGRPQYYSITNRINFERIAGGSYDYTLTCYKKLDLATDSTNDVLTDYPSIYLYGSLIQAEPYLKNDQRVGTWVALFEDAVKSANNRNQQNLRKLRTDHPSIPSSFDILRG